MANEIVFFLGISAAALAVTSAGFDCFELLLLKFNNFVVNSRVVDELAGMQAKGGKCSAAAGADVSKVKELLSHTTSDLGIKLIKMLKVSVLDVCSAFHRMILRAPIPNRLMNGAGTYTYLVRTYTIQFT